MRDRIGERDRAFIHARDMFFLATADEEGRPQCSYKGGDPGFVRVLDERTIAFPVYDGNGMYLSAGTRYIHQYELVLRSRFVPREKCETTVPAWKTSDWAHDALPKADPAYDESREVLER